ncbi:MAG TPA: amidohydrolase family protein [Thermoanaerobaculia bacterium]|nr:amidohydrolase family protein [Thermoanaerobaculia bacterium]
MIIDVHIHVQPWQMLRPEALALMDDEAHRGVADLLSDPKLLLQHLDANGIDRACCINYVSPEVMGFDRTTNDWIAGFTRDHRDRLLPVGSVNPLHEDDPAAELRRVLALGIRMIKIHPPHQLFAANAYLFDLPRLAEIYAECERRSIPVMIHTGTSVFPRARNRFADPMPVDDVAIDFPSLRIILAHAGRPLHGETAFFLARRHPNVMLDVSGIPPKSLLRHLPRLAEIADKVLWGTDWPSPGVVSMARNVEAFRSLGLGEAVERKILSENAERLFWAS